MLLALLVTIIISLLVSFTCSLVEAAIYAVPVTYVKALAEQKATSAKILAEFKEDIARPITLILFVNTASNALGPMLIGWLASESFSGSPLSIAMISLLFTALLLVAGELIPKTLGVVYCRPVALAAAWPIHLLSIALKPLVVFSRWMQRRLESEEQEPTVSHEEVLSMAELGTEEGALDDFEGEVISNVIGLDRVLVKDILTPRVVVFRLKDSTSLGEVEHDIQNWQFSRIPLYSEDDADHLSAYVTQRDIFKELLRGNKELRLKELGRPLETVPELMPVDKLLQRMFERKEHICAVVDEHGGLAGIITMEDIIEEVVGTEIVDEYDAVSDLRTFAKILRVAKRKPKQSKQKG